METQLDVYDLCRNFVNDNSETLPPIICKKILGLVRSRSYQLLAGVTCLIEHDYQCARTYKSLLQIEAFFKKNADFRDSAKCREAAESTFQRGERLCRITNRRLDHYYVERGRLDPDLQQIVRKAERFIHETLGPIEVFLAEIPSLLKITGGASAGFPRSRSAPPQKLRKRLACAPGTVPYLKATAKLFGHRIQVKEQLWNRVEFVSKSWKTDRTIACEPEGSTPFQLAFDNYAKARLRRVGIDLSDQTRNQEHAMKGSIDGSIATIDLSMASDTLSYNTVAWLLPKPWLDYLDAHRSKLYLLDGKYGRYAKFSSMGNGATFALESLVFLSLVRACGSSDGLVYGDDITIETELVPQLLKALTFFGFTVNVDKSHYTGPYRESCGAHFVNGTLVTPFFVRSTSTWDKPNACHNVNGLAKVCEHQGVWTLLKAFVETNRLPFTPYSLDTMTGVHLDVQHSYRKKLIRTKNDVQFAKAYCSKSPSSTIVDSRALFLWFLTSSKRLESWDPLCNISNGSAAGTYSTLRHKFVRKWVNWNIPVMGVPGHLYGFSDFILPPNDRT